MIKALPSTFKDCLPIRRITCFFSIAHAASEHIDDPFRTFLPREQEGIAQGGRRDAHAGKLVYSDWTEGRMDREAAPEPETPAVAQRLAERRISTPLERRSSPIFALNDQVDWTTPTFEERGFQSAVIQDEGESGSEASSDEDEIDALADSDEDFDERRSPIPLGTSDLDIGVEVDNEEQKDVEEGFEIVPSTSSHEHHSLAYASDHEVRSHQVPTKERGKGMSVPLFQIFAFYNIV
jgi:hypothetical protein